MTSTGAKGRELFNEVEIMHNDSVNGDSRRTTRNKNSGNNARATSVYSNDTWDGLDYTLRIGITSSNYTGLPDSQNCGFIQNDTNNRFSICNLQNQPFRFGINFTDDRTLGNITDVFEITKTDGYLKSYVGVLQLKETTTPTAVVDYGAIYTKNDNKLYFQDGAGSEKEIATAESKDRVSLYKSIDQTIVKLTWVDLTFDNENWDVGNLHDNITNNARVTVNTTGWYRISYLINIQSKKDTDYQGRIYKNGISLVPNSQMCIFSPKDDIDVCIHNNFEAYLTANDYITLQAYQGSAGDRNVRATETFLQVTQIS